MKTQKKLVLTIIVFVIFALLIIGCLRIIFNTSMSLVSGEPDPVVFSDGRHMSFVDGRLLGLKILEGCQLSPSNNDRSVGFSAYPLKGTVFAAGSLQWITEGKIRTAEWKVNLESHEITATNNEAFILLGNVNSKRCP